MDIRTKFVLALVAVSLGGMLALGWLTYGATRTELRRTSLRQLEAVAASKAQALENVMAGWRDRVGLISSRTQLRMSLRTYADTGDPAARERVARIVQDVVSWVPSVRRVRVLDPRGDVVVDSGVGDPDVRRVLPPEGGNAGGILYHGLAVKSDGSLVAEFRAPLIVDGEDVGSIEVTLSADELLKVTSDYAGLDTTGESLIGQIVGDSVLILSTTRHDPALPLMRAVSLENTESPLVRAASGVEGSFDSDLADYRGQAVRASTRFLSEPGWGVVVKLDETEESAAVNRLRREMLRLALSLSAFAILFGTLLGLRFAKPIHDLAEVARRIERGELDARADIRSEDEIGMLAATFNRMADELIDTNKDLERQVEETRDLDRAERQPRPDDPIPEGSDPGSGDANRGSGS